MRHALFLPLFDQLAEPAVVVRLAAEAEEAGWDGVFVWDHVSYRAPVTGAADPWIILAAMACATEQVRLGPMVTPLPRRRPIKLAREITTLDRLSGGRVTFGVGIGGDGAGELSATGEQLSDRVRGQMLDEGLTILQAAWTGEPLTHRGEHYTADGLTLLPTPVQRPGPPVWVAMRAGNAAPLRRAARFDGIFPIELTGPDQLAGIVTDVRAQRAAAGLQGAYDVAAGGPPGTDQSGFAEAGATWWMAGFSPYDLQVDEVRGVLREGPQR